LLLSLFEDIPQIKEVFEEYPALQPDLTRYLALWYHGGLYADIETWERISLLACSPIVEVRDGRRNVSLMLGVGFDEPYLTHAALMNKGWTRGVGFAANPVIWAPRRFDPILRMAIVRSVSHSKSLKELGGNIEEVSGSAMLTDVVLEVLSKNLIEGHKLRDRDAGLERRVTWKHFKDLKETVWIEADQLHDKSSAGGLAILPIDVWGNGQGHSGSGSLEAAGACVNWIPGKLAA
jgi:alpha 1,6-mannosyltransferase